MTDAWIDDWKLPRRNILYKVIDSRKATVFVEFLFKIGIHWKRLWFSSVEILDKFRRVKMYIFLNNYSKVFYFLLYPLLFWIFFINQFKRSFNEPIVKKKKLNQTSEHVKACGEWRQKYSREIEGDHIHIIFRNGLHIQVRDENQVRHRGGYLRSFLEKPPVWSVMVIIWYNCFVF